MNRFKIERFIEKAIEKNKNPSRKDKMDYRLSFFTRLIFLIDRIFGFDKRDKKKFDKYSEEKELARYYETEYLEFQIVEQMKEVASDRFYLTAYFPTFLSMIFFVTQMKIFIIGQNVVFIICISYIPLYCICRRSMNQSERRLLIYQSVYKERVGE